MVVYFVSNESFGDDVYKIGYSDNVAMRIAHLNIGVPTPFKKEILLEGGNELEREVHQRFDQFRVESGREFFSIEENTMIDFIREMCDEYPGKIIYLDKKWQRRIEEYNMFDPRGEGALCQDSSCENVEIHFTNGRIDRYGYDEKDYFEVIIQGNAVWVYDGKYTHNNLKMFPLHTIEAVYLQYPQTAGYGEQGPVRVQLPENLDTSRMENKYGD